MRTTSTTPALILMVSIIPLATIWATTVYAQVPTQTTATAPEVKAILDATQALCIEEGVRQCMTVDYQSANLVALHGESLLPSGPNFYSNFYLWETVDKLQTTLGFRINSMAPSGVGTEANPTILYVVLSK
jgi:hypothetical protein